VEVGIWIGVDDQNGMFPCRRLPGQQGRQGGFTDSAFAAERDFHDVSLPKKTSPQRSRRGRAAIENSRFKIQDPSLQKSLPEKQQITILYYRGHGEKAIRTIRQ
jgi:hypothetical protein